MGRPTTLSAEVQAKLLEAFGVGATDKIAADYANIGLSTYYEWMAKGTLGQDPYAEFAEEVKRAKTKCDILDLSAISEARTGTVIVHDEVQITRPARRITHPDGRVEEFAAWVEIIPRRVERIPGDWRAAGHRLACRHPDDFAKRAKHEVTLTPPAVVIDVSALPEEQQEALARWDD